MKTNSFFMLSLSLGLFFTSCSVEDYEGSLSDNNDANITSKTDGVDDILNANDLNSTKGGEEVSHEGPIDE